MHKLELRFMYVMPTVLPELKYTENTSNLKGNECKLERICSVDLGINTDATCSIIRHDGTVTAREFINHAGEKDHMYRLL